MQRRDFMKGATLGAAGVVFVTCALANLFLARRHLFIVRPRTAKRLEIEPIGQPKSPVSYPPGVCEAKFASMSAYVTVTSDVP